MVSSRLTAVASIAGCGSFYLPQGARTRPIGLSSRRQLSAGRSRACDFRQELRLDPDAFVGNALRTGLRLPNKRFCKSAAETLSKPRSPLPPAALWGTNLLSARMDLRSPLRVE